MVHRAARGKAYQVDVFEVPTAGRPVSLGGFTITSSSVALARLLARDEVWRQYPRRIIRSFTSNRRTGGFIVYLKE